MKLLHLFAFAITFFTASPSVFALTAICETHVNVTLPDGACEMNANPAWIDGGSFDPSGRPLTFTVSPSLLSLGEQNVILRVSNGVSTNSCWSQVTVIDRSMPSLNCEPVNIYLVAPDQHHISDPTTWYNLDDDCGGKPDD